MRNHLIAGHDRISRKMSSRIYLGCGTCLYCFDGGLYFVIGAYTCAVVQVEISH